MWHKISKRLTILQLWREEFTGYNLQHFRSDLIAGLTVAAVALPLALAFGIAGGATAAAGLVTAIVAGLVIGAFSGAPYQISGPTGAMSAVLIVVAQKYGLTGVWLATLLAGLIILGLGLFKLGRIINFIPAPVITGFTSGIALIIFIGQIDNLLGIKTPAEDSALRKAIGYFTHSLPGVNMPALLCAGLVVVTMLALPKLKFCTRWPAALLGITLATACSKLVGWQVATVGKIPGSLLLDERLRLNFEDLSKFSELLGPASAIAALGAIESLLAGVVAGRMTGIKLEANQELVAQGVGNLILPFFGGVPATAAIARISVGVKSGGLTRLVSIIHALALLVSVLFLSEIIAYIPLAALAGVLMVTAWRMNEWHILHYYFKHRLKGPICIVLVTMAATISLDLTQAIIIGIVLSLLIFISQSSRLEITPTKVDWQRFQAAGNNIVAEQSGIWVVYISGALYFGTVSQFSSKIEQLTENRVLVLSMRGVAMLDVSGLHALENLWQEQLKNGRQLYFTGLQEPVRRLFERTGLLNEIGADKFFWSADQAIASATELLVQHGQACELPTTLQSAKSVIVTAEDLEDMPLGVTKVKS